MARIGWNTRVDRTRRTWGVPLTDSARRREHRPATSLRLHALAGERIHGRRKPMKPSRYVPLLAVPALVACAPAEPAAGGRAPITTTFICPQSQLVTVSFSDGLARLTTAGVDAELVRQPSGSGYSYAGEGHSLRGQGTALTWTDAAGTVRQCEDQIVSMSRPQVQERIPALAGTSWQLAYFDSSDDAIGHLVPPRLERYTAEFTADGAASFQLDCNRLASRWTQTAVNASGGSIAFAPGAMTRAFCGEEAMDARIARDLAKVRSFTIVGDRLTLALEADAGTYVWTRRAGS
jgi:heat shock protein HslJ